jgi:hypothetical protein
MTQTSKKTKTATKATKKRPGKRTAKKAVQAAKDAKAAAKRDTGERGATSGKTGGKDKVKKTSLLDAAAHLLSLGTGDPMRCRDIVDLAIKRNLWTPDKGKTPASSLYAAVHREIKAKGKDARFRKAERGKFALNR